MRPGSDKFIKTHQPTPAIAALHLVTLFTLAIIHPLYEVLSQQQHANFFSSHKAQAPDIWILVIVWSMIIPLAIVILLWLIRLVSEPAARVANFVIVTSCFAIVFTLLCGQIFPDSEVLGVLIALAATAGVATLYAKTSWMSICVTFMSPVIVISPIMFLTSLSISSLLSPMKAEEVRIVSTHHELPTIVLIVLDELPLISLLNGNREIDPVRYPNFARLAQTSTWYREASTVSNLTRDALPAVLTGSYLREYLKRIEGDIEGKPDAMEFSANFLSLLQASHEILAIESMTEFAPHHPATFRYILPLWRRIPGLVTDSLLISVHIVSPSIIGDKLPPLYGRWSDFLGSAPTTAIPMSDWPYLGKEPDRARNFIELIKKREKPSFYFLHLLLPHNPFSYNEIGQLHSIKAPFQKYVRRIASDNAWRTKNSAERAHQAHLLQLSFTDLLLGRIFDKLVAMDLFDSALIVVTADHGISFYWDSDNLPEEEIVSIRASEVMYVPLFIKAPQQTDGKISDQLVQLVDIVPTIAEMLIINIPWQMDGVSALSGNPPAVKRKGRFPIPMEFDLIIDPKHRALHRKLSLFGSGDMEKIYAMGPHTSVIGKAVTSMPSRNTNAIARFEKPDRTLNMDLRSSKFPAYIEGHITDYTSKSASTYLFLAIAVNGVIRGVSSAIEEDGKLRFITRVPPHSFKQGPNFVTVHGVIESAQTGTFSLVNFTQQ